mgnify:FL=1
MEYRRFKDTIVARLDRGEEILAQVKEIALKEEIKLASVQALGAMNKFTVGVFKTDEKEYASRIESVRNFERQLTDNGYLVLKFFMQIEKKEQKEREQNLLESKDTKWRVSLFDQWEKCTL